MDTDPTPMGASARRAAPSPSFVTDTWVIAQRNLLAITRQPQLLVFVVIQPVLFVLLFRYVFGGAVQAGEGVRYVDFLMPGIITQTVAFGAMNTAIAIATDMGNGIVDRFRALPMSRGAVLGGRVLADAVRLCATILIMAAIGVLVGWRPHVGPGLVVGFLVAVGFGTAMSVWSTLVGLLAGTEEAAQAFGFVSTFPLTFASSVFVPVTTMPGWLQTFAKVNPITLVASSMRALSMHTPVGRSLWQAVAWMVGISVVAGFFAMRRYSRVT